MTRHLPIVLVALLAVAGAATSANAAEVSIGCCVCNCGSIGPTAKQGTTSGANGDDLLCFDNVGMGSCKGLCDSLDCVSEGVEDSQCSAIADCATEATMAPAYTIGGLLLVGVALAALGIYATNPKRRSSRAPL